MKLIVCLLLSAALLIIAPARHALANPATPVSHEAKNAPEPALALLLEILVPGLGLLYAKSTPQGILVMVLGCLGTLLYWAGALNSTACIFLGILRIAAIIAAPIHASKKKREMEAEHSLATPLERPIPVSFGY